MPVRDYEPAYLEQALASVLGQTSPHWLLLVIDDGADSSLDEIVAATAGDDRVRTVPSEPRGFAAALNTGLRHAGTDFLSLLFADDRWASNVIEVLTSSIERWPEVDVHYGSRQYIDDEGQVISDVYGPRESFAVADFEKGSPVKHPFSFRRSAALEVGGFDESLAPHGVDDYDFLWSLAEAGARFMAVPECIYLYRDHREGVRLTTHVPRSVQRRTLRRMMEKHGMESARIESFLRQAEQDYLRQALYRSRFDRWLKRVLRHDPRRGWRESYE
jgi:glycosyltransferase involved in cell wall biosynthesis